MDPASAPLLHNQRVFSRSPLFCGFHLRPGARLIETARSMSTRSHRPFKISVLVFVRDRQNRFLLLQRAREPNKGMWSPIGGKLEMSCGESPFECAIRETKEEIGVTVTEKDLHLFSMVSEKDYEGSGHWLMFLFDCRQPVDELPPSIDEGVFGFFTREELKDLPIPDTDRAALWPIHDRYHDGFVALRADCDPAHPLQITIEESRESDAAPCSDSTLPE